MIITFELGELISIKTKSLVLRLFYILVGDMVIEQVIKYNTSDITGDMITIRRNSFYAHAGNILFESFFFKYCVRFKVTQALICTHNRSRTHIHSHKHTYTHIYTHIQTYTQSHAHRCARTHTTQHCLHHYKVPTTIKTYSCMYMHENAHN